MRAQEPSSAHAGDRAIVLADGTIEGFVGGQCAAGSVRTAALDALESGVGVLLRVLPDSDDSFPQTPGASIVVNPCLSGGALEIYLEPLLPSPALYLVGTSPTAEAIADLAPTLGFVVDRAGEGARPDGAVAAVISSHGGDEPAAIRAALDAGVGFVGLVCSHTRGEAVLAELDLTEDEREPRAPPRRRRHRRTHGARDRAVDPRRDRQGHPARGARRQSPGREPAASAPGGRPGLRHDRHGRSRHRPRGRRRHRPLVLQPGMPRQLPRGPHSGSTPGRAS